MHPSSYRLVWYTMHRQFMWSAMVDINVYKLACLVHFYSQHNTLPSRNEFKPNLFRIIDGVILCNLRDQLNGLLNYDDTRRLINVEYRRPSIGSYGRVRFTKMKLQSYIDIRTILSIFYQYSSFNEPIKLDVK